MSVFLQVPETWRPGVFITFRLPVKNSVVLECQKLSIDRSPAITFLTDIELLIDRLVRYVSKYQIVRGVWSSRIAKHVGLFGIYQVDIYN